MNVFQLRLKFAEKSSGQFLGFRRGGQKDGNQPFVDLLDIAGVAVSQCIEQNLGGFLRVLFRRGLRHAFGNRSNAVRLTDQFLVNTTVVSNEFQQIQLKTHGDREEERTEERETYSLLFVFIFDLLDIENLQESKQTADIEKFTEVFIAGRRLKEDAQRSQLLVQAGTEEITDA